MPEMNGLELCRAVRAGDLPGYVYLILLTAHDRAEEKVIGLGAGADDFIAKPFNPAELIARVHTAERVLSLETREVAIFAMAKLAESRDPETGAHLERVRSYSRILAQQLAQKSAFQSDCQCRVYSADLPNQPAARHRQGRHPRYGASQARAIERSRIRDHEDPHVDWI